MNKLIVSGYAFAKIAAFRALADTETSGFAVFDEDGNIVDFRMVKHEATAASIEFDEAAHDEYVLEQIEKGHRENITNCWWHTHPGGVTASGTDNKMFEELLESMDVVFMLIYADHKFSCRMGLKQGGFTICKELSVAVDHTLPWGEETLEDWEQQLKTLCTKRTFTYKPATVTKSISKYPAARESSYQKWWDRYELELDDVDIPDIPEPATLTASDYHKAETEYMSRVEGSGNFEDGAAAAWNHLVFDIDPEEPTSESAKLAWAEGYAEGMLLIRMDFREYVDEEVLNVS